MPKPIRAVIEIEEFALGKVMRALNAMPGIASFNLDLDEDTKKKRANGGKRREGPTNRTLALRALLAAKAPVESSELKKKVVAAGGTDTFSTELTKMKGDGHLNQPKPFHWQLTAKGRKWAAEREKRLQEQSKTE